MKKLITSILLLTSSLAYADMNWTLKRPEEAVRPEPVVSVERYDPNQFRNDPSVLISPARITNTDIGFNNPRVLHREKSSKKENVQEDVLIKTQWCDDESGCSQWR